MKKYIFLLMQLLIAQGILTAQNLFPTPAGDAKLAGANALEFGQGLTKEVNAGKIAYQKFSDGLDIIGAGTTSLDRKIKFHAEGGSSFNGNLNTFGTLTVGFNNSLPSFFSTFINHATDPDITLNQSSAPPNERLWQILASGGVFRLITEADDYSAIQDALKITRSGVNVTNVLFPNGNVGIGTSNPSAKLNVYNSGPTQVIVGNPSTSTGGFTSLLMGTSANSNGYSYVQSVKSSGTALGDIILNKDGGNVGIGTTQTDAKLTVNGTVHTKEVKVDLSVPGPDYVFEPSYDLKSLAEIETYIKENKHLPEVPSAKEMEKNGVQLGEMNMLLLRKVEELTLYILDQNKEIEKLKERSVSPDALGKKVEELTLHLIEMKNENNEAKEMNKRLADKIEKIEGKMNNKN